MGPKFAYNDASTAFDREFSLLLNEIDAAAARRAARRSRSSSGRSTGPSTGSSTAAPTRTRSSRTSASRGADPDLDIQPISSLDPGEPGDRVLLRIANLGYEQHSMVLPGITMTVVGEDATPLSAGLVLTYDTNTIYIGPGESRDVLFTAPPFDGGYGVRKLDVRALEHLPLQEPQLRPADERRRRRARRDGHRGARLRPEQRPALPLQGPTTRTRPMRSARRHLGLEGPERWQRA